ncbi:Ditrans polycis-polyprenyl diphosphate synthase ((2E 6E)-farnesyl diphosphate specific) [Fasciolopsis buskii]|uniref:Alkyl transferase n=1 Tax=Fasciolopsis buskii TaxID=27845 RepID=A0A8E0S1K4_9TREM|nr:Ditrans polycis-polyprenyl diphosphate synthase ((2E 6E)-farnesyl diphosphate specific) [Fasciolopsis buski]
MFSQPSPVISIDFLPFRFLCVRTSTIMTWAWKETKYSFVQRCCLRILKCGPIPKHVGFIMDGNRRYANKKNMACSAGHAQGFLKLSEALSWCRDFGVEELSVYAFSIENFKRKQSEVNFLFQLASNKLQELLDKRDELKENGVCVRVIGNLSLLPPDIQILASEVMLITRCNTKAVLNIYMAYTGRDDLSQAIERIRTGVVDKLILPDDIDTQLLSSCLHSRLSRPLDLLIRTSGEVRLSDFLVWSAATSGTVHKFVSNFWPEFSFWEFAQSILYYQLSNTYLSRLHLSIPAAESFSSTTSGDKDHANRVQRFLDSVDQAYWKQLESLTCSTSRCLGEIVRG